jgi:hypothetical protein
MIGSYSESSCIWIVFISKNVTDHKLLEDVHEFVSNSIVLREGV